MKCDVVVLGGGPAGYTAAIRLSQLDKKVCLIEDNFLGGTCMNEGCIPTKALLKEAEIMSELNSREYGFCGNGDIPILTALERKQKIVVNSRKGLETLLKNNNVIVKSGFGEIEDEHNLVIYGDTNEEEVEFDNLIIATGSLCSIPRFIKGYDLKGVIKSTEALNLDNIPQSLTIIGGGVIGVELASYFAAFGCKVTILEYMPHILPMFDEDVSDSVLRVLKKQGIKCVTNAKVKEIQKTNDMVVLYDIDGEEKTIDAAMVLLAMGRTPNIDLCAAKINLNLDKKGFVVVNDNYQTNYENIYACGDVIGGKMLAHMAYAEGRRVAEIIAGKAKGRATNICPSCVYTIPEIAVVGITEKEAIENNITYRVGKANLRTNGRCQTLGIRDGFVKILVDTNNTIIGAAIVGANASEMISELTFAISNKTSIDTLADVIHPHPSVSEGIWEVANALCSKPIHT